MSSRIATVTPSDGLNLRAAPATSATVITILKEGTEVTITGAALRWRRVECAEGNGFAHGDYLTVDGVHAVADDEPCLDQLLSDDGQDLSTSGTYTVQPGDILSTIGARLGITWQLIASANGLQAPFTIFPGQVLILPGGAPVPSPVVTGRLDILNPLSGSTLVTSSSNQGHHTPYGGSRSCDVAILGRSSAGQPARLNVAAPDGIELRGVVAEIGFACASGRLDDGGHKVRIALQTRTGGGDWRDTGSWVLFAHIDPVLVAVGDVLGAGERFGALGRPDGSDYSSSCATASHTHVEATNASWVIDIDSTINAAAVMRIDLD